MEDNIICTLQLQLQRNEPVGETENSPLLYFKSLSRKVVHSYWYVQNIGQGLSTGIIILHMEHKDVFTSILFLFFFFSREMVPIRGLAQLWMLCSRFHCGNLTLVKQYEGLQLRKGGAEGSYCGGGEINHD